MRKERALKQAKSSSSSKGGVKWVGDSDPSQKGAFEKGFDSLLGAASESANGVSSLASERGVWGSASWAGFTQEDEDEVVTKEQFREYLKIARGGAGKVTNAALDAEVELIFAMLDEDGTRHSKKRVSERAEAVLLRLLTLDVGPMFLGNGEDDLDGLVNRQF